MLAATGVVLVAAGQSPASIVVLSLTVVAASFVAGVVGSALAVRRVVSLPPAEAMRPAAPDNYRNRTLTDLVLGWLSPSARMIAREIMRRPSRTLFSAAAIAASIGIVVTGQFFSDAMGFLFDFYMQKSQRETISVVFHRPVPQETVYAFSAIEGVRDAGRYLARIAPVDICPSGSVAGYATKLRDIIEDDIGGNGLFPPLVTVNSVTPSVACVPGSYRTDPAPIATVSASLTISFPLGSIFGLFGVALTSVTTTVADSARIYGQ